MTHVTRRDGPRHAGAGHGTSGAAFSDPAISGEIVAPVLQALEACGVDRAALGAFPPAAGDMVPGAAADRWLDAAADLLHDEALGLTLARRLPIGALGLIDYALCASTSLRAALARVARHYGAVTQRVYLSLHEAPPQAMLLFERRSGTAHSRHWIEFSFAIIAERMRQTLGRDVRFERVSFRHGPPASADAHDAFFGTRVAFSAPGDRLCFAHALLDGRLRTAAAALAELLDGQMAARRPPEDAHASDALVCRVRQKLRSLLDDGDVRVETVATELATSTRTLQRELGRRGTSHKALLDEVRRDRALELLNEGRSTVAEIAGRLAYAEPSAFFRAFRRWTGTSPRTKK